MIEITGLTKIYRSKRQKTIALNDINLTLPDKGMVFLLGKSGCGKTTLLNMLGAMDTFDDGEIFVEGRALSSLSLAERDAYRNTYVGFVFQEYNLIEDFDVWQNIAVAQELQRIEPSSEKISEILIRLGLQGLEKRRTDELSGGQRQRVAIARALIKDPHLLLCDEPTGALDSEAGESIMNLLKQISRDRLVVIVSHDRDFAERFGDSIVELKDGKVVSDSLPVCSSDEEDKLSLTFARLKTGRAFSMGVRTALKKPIRMSLSVLLLALTTFVLSLAIIVAGFNFDLSVARTIVNNGREYNVLQLRYFKGDGDDVAFPGRKVSFNADEKMIDDFAELSGLPAVGKVSAGLQGECFAPSLTNYKGWQRDNAYPDIFTNCAKFGGYVAIDENVCRNFGFELVGRLPEKYDEIVITQYSLRSFITYGYSDRQGNTAEISSAEDMLGKSIVTGNIYYDGEVTLKNSYTVCGVITNLDIDIELFKSRYKNADFDGGSMLEENIEREVLFLRDNYLNNVCFVSDQRLKDLAAENADYSRTTGLLKSGALLGRKDPLPDNVFIADGTYNYNNLIDSVRICAEEDISDIGLDIEYSDNEKTLKDGRAALSLHELVILIDRYDVKLLAEDAEKFGCSTLSEYLDKNLFTSENVGKILLEEYYSGVMPDEETFKEDVNYVLSRLLNRQSFVYGIDFSRLCYEDVAPVIAKYADDITIYTGGYDTVVKNFLLGGVVFYKSEEVSENYEFHKGAICMSASDAEEITYGAYGNCYNGIISPMPSSVNRVYSLWKSGNSEEEGLKYVMNAIESDVVNDYVSSTRGNAVAFSVIGGIMGIMALLLIFNFITNSVSIRKKDISILRNLGAGRREVCKIFYMESVITAVISIVIATIFTAAGAYAFNCYFASFIFENLKCLVFEWWVPFVIFGITLAITFMVTLLTLARKLKR